MSLPSISYRDFTAYFQSEEGNSDWIVRKEMQIRTQIQKSPDSYESGLHVLVAERTGLEPATPCVTGRYSNQLNYRSTDSVLNSDCV